MAIQVGTHSGTFHADDVLAFALVRKFVDSEATVVRTRCKETLAKTDIVIDVGGVYDVDTLRFDHHQQAYAGPLSSAGMVLQWLSDSDRISTELYQWLAENMVNYVDAVDTGKQAPEIGRPCFCRLVAAMTDRAVDATDMDHWYLQSAGIAASFLDALCAGFDKAQESKRVVLKAMQESVDDGRSFIEFDGYCSWKTVYFANGGEQHPTAFVLFPSEDTTWKLVAIPPRFGEFGQKRSLPESWAGKMGDELSEATGVAGSVFCHKNRFIAVFATRDAVIEAMRRFDLYDL